jgi:hypothetical protein
MHFGVMSMSFIFLFRAFLEFLPLRITRDLGLVVEYLQWNGCKATLVSLGFLVVDYWDTGGWIMLDKSIYH